MDTKGLLSAHAAVVRGPCRYPFGDCRRQNCVDLTPLRYLTRTKIIRSE